MGATESKSPSRRNSTSSRTSKVNDIKVIQNAIFDIRRLLETSTDIRQQYDSYYEILTQNSHKICEIRKNLKPKSSDYKICTDILTEVNDCINLLDARRSTTESNLDVSGAFTTTTSIIGMDIQAPKNSGASERIKSLSEMEMRMNKIDAEIRKSFEINDYSTLTFLEKKIKVLYHDLDLYNARPFSQEQERKKKMSQKLVKFHNKIRSLKRSSQNFSQDNNDGAAFSRPSKSSSHENLKTIMDIEQDLNDDEVAVLTFEHTKEDNRFDQLNQKLRDTYIKLDSLSMESKDNKGRVENAKHLTKKILHELNKKGNENEGIVRRNKAEIDAVESDVLKLKKKIEEFQGTIGESDAKKFNHELTSLNEKLNDIKSEVEKIKEHKENVIVEINNTLKLLNKKNKTLVPDIQAITMTTTELKNAWIKLLDTIGDINIRQNRLIFTTLKDISSSLNQILEQDYEDKPSEANIFTDHLRDVQKIEDRITRINQEVSSFNDTSDSKEFEDYENILLKHKNEVEKIPTGRNTLNIAKDRVLFKINEAAMVLRKKAEVFDSNNKEKRQSVFVINRIINSLQSFEEEIDRFKGTLENPKFFELQQTLSSHKDVLEGSDDSVFEDVDTKKNIIDHINKLKFKLTQVASNNKNNLEQIDELKGIVRNVRTIKARVDCFNGLFKDEQYVELENDIKREINNLNKMSSESNKVRKNKMQTMVSLQKYLRELEEKSLKVEANAKKKLFNKIDSTLVEIREYIENFKGSKGDEDYYRILGQIYACDDEVNLIDDEEAGKRLSYQKHLRTLKTSLEELTLKPMPVDNSSIINENLIKIEMIESTMNSLEESIRNFQGKRSDDEYGELDANLIKLMVDLDRINSIRIPSITQKRKELLVKLNENAALLDAKAQEATLSNEQYVEIRDEIGKISFDVQVLHDGIINFKGMKHDSQHSYLDEALIKLIMRLERIDPMGDGGLKTLKQEALRDIQRNMQMLEKATSGFIQMNGLDALEGTQV